MKYWEIIADNLKERGWSQRWGSTWPGRLVESVMAGSFCHLADQKRFQRDPVKRIGAAFRAVKLGAGNF
jgi:hypothetical protein